MPVTVEKDVLKSMLVSNKLTTTLTTYSSVKGTYTEPYINDDNSTYKIAPITTEPLDLDSNGVFDKDSYCLTTTKTITYSYSSQLGATLLATGTQTLGYASKATTNKDSNYTYKVMGTTSGTAMTDVVLYAYFNTAAKNNWNGVCTGIDTSALISGGYTPKIYYTTSSAPNLLTDTTNSWLTYSNSVSKENIKGIAIKLNTASGSAATVPADSTVYALINMTSPSEPSGKYTYATGFVDWNPTVTSSVTGVSTNEATVEIIEDDIVAAPTEYTLTTSITNGTITPTTGTVAAGSTQTVTFTPNSGYYVSSVKVDDVEQIGNIINNSVAFPNVAANHTVVVTCSKYYSVTTSKTGSGTVTVSDTQLKSGASKTITYEPSTGYYVSSVKVDGTTINLTNYPDSYTFSNITANHTVVVVFTKYLTVAATVTGGTITPTSSTVKSGGSQTVTYAPTDSSYYLDSVTVNGSSVSTTSYADSYTFSNITSNQTISVVYKKYVSITTAATNGTITSSLTKQKQPLTTTITYTPQNTAAYYLASVKVNGSAVSTTTYASTYKFSAVTSDQSIEVEYAPYYTVAASITHGTISGSSTTLKAGDTAKITYSADEGYYISSIKVDGSVVSLTTYASAYTFSSVSANHTIEVVCTKYLSVNTNVSNGIITDTDSAIKSGSSKTVTYSPKNSSYYLLSVQVNGAAVSTSTYASSYTFSNITSNQTIEVTYAPYSGIQTSVTGGYNYAILRLSYFW